MCAFIRNVFRLLFFIQIPKIQLYFYHGIEVLCVVLTVYHDLNVCYYGRPMINKKKKKKIAIILTDVTDFANEQQLASAS